MRRKKERSKQGPCTCIIIFIVKVTQYNVVHMSYWDM